jgi:hypothetical protein
MRNLILLPADVDNHPDVQHPKAPRGDRTPDRDPRLMARLIRTPTAVKPLLGHPTATAENGNFTESTVTDSGALGRAKGQAEGRDFCCRV